MGDFVLRAGDSIKITIVAPALVPQLLKPGVLLGTGTSVLAGAKPVCLQGDEMPPEWLTPLPYTSPPFITPGMGKLTLMLTPANFSKQTMHKKPLLLKGAGFPVLFTVQVPAMQPTPTGPVPDPVPVKNGTGQFITANTTVQVG